MLRTRRHGPVMSRRHWQCELHMRVSCVPCCLCYVLLIRD